MLLPLLLAAAMARAAPTLVYAPMAQQPPVARVGTEFTFDLLPSTFNSTSSMTYTTSSLPSWLAFDPTLLVYSGTPAAADAGATDITLTATDGTGATGATWTCLVTADASPAVHASFETQIADPSTRAFASASALPGNTGVSVPPHWSFSLGWSSTTFRQAYTGGNGHLYWAAHVRDQAGLPSWLGFSNDSFTFNGVAPAEGSYTVVVTGTDYWGYSAAETSFVIEVGQGEPIEMTGNWSTVEGVTGSEISYVVDTSAYTIGGEAAASSDLTLDVTTTYLDWLSFDATSNTLSGTVPTAFKNGTVTPLSIAVQATPTNTSNTYTLTTWLSMSLAPYAFSSTNLTANATAEHEFTFDLAPYVVNSSATVNATVSPEGAASWLTFFPANLSLVGTPPKNANSSVEVSFAATTGGVTSIAELDIALSGVTRNSTSSTSGSAPVPTGTVSSHGLSTGAKIALGVVLGLLGLVLLALLLFCCCRRRKREQREASISEKDVKDDASFVAGSPIPHDPFGRKPLAVILNPIPHFSGLHLRASTDGKSAPSNATSPRAASFETGTTAAVLASPGKPTRLDGLKGIFGWGGHKDADGADDDVLAKPARLSSETSFEGEGDVIGISDGLDGADDDAGGSSFTHSLASSSASGSSRASWESRATFRWSSADGSHDASHAGADSRHRLSAAPSIPRPRPNFTPRYPRTRSPTQLARLASEPSLDNSSFSEFRDSRVLVRDRSSFAASGSEPSLGTASASTFPSGPAGLDRFASSGAFPSVRSIDEADEDASSSYEEPAVVRLAERQSLETRRPTTEERPTPKLRPSRERVSTVELASPVGRRSASQTVMFGARDSVGSYEQPAGEGVFDDADEARRSTYAPSEVNGLGYPASAIYFGSEAGDRVSAVPSDATATGRASTIRVVPAAEGALSPPLPTVGTFMRHRRTGTNGSIGRVPRPMSTTGDGRVVACANETFSIHPSLNPPPTVSLSAATWSSAPPSTYRAVLDSGAALPAWLHFDARELELWGVPHEHDAGATVNVRIVERMPNANRRSDPLAFGYQPPQERDVGRVVIEVMDRLRSPQFALEDGTHAM